MVEDYIGRIILLDGEDECRITSKLGYGQLYRIEHSDGTTDTITTELIKKYIVK